jgi:hypothetical protein
MGGSGGADLTYARRQESHRYDRVACLLAREKGIDEGLVRVCSPGGGNMRLDNDVRAQFRLWGGRR